MSLEIEAVYEKGVLKLPRTLPFDEGATVKITIHSPDQAGAGRRTVISMTGSSEELERWLNDPDEGMWGNRDV